jgi:linoleate 10R-lipoxygenase
MISLEVYKDLAHPPTGYLALPKQPILQSTGAATKNVPYAFRDSDGVNYNPLFPTMGQTSSPYARSVASTSITPVSSLPDPGLIFDTLLKRSGEFEPHPGGISSLFFAFADLVIHSIFNTDHSDWTINATSSYLDLSPLYGNSKAEVDRDLGVRRKDGSGKLWDDVFADGRLLFMPPSVCALLVLFNRNHNYIAEKILSINERSTFSPLPLSDSVAKLAQDDEIFHRARLVNCGFFMKVILGDYVGAILGLARDCLAWRLDPLMVS